MDPIHKKVLANKTSEIMKRISNPVVLSAHLKTIFSAVDMEEIMAKTFHHGATTGTRTMLSTLEKRGPKAFTLFIEALRHPAISNADLADDLEQEERKLRGEAGAIIREATSAPASPNQWDINYSVGTLNLRQKKVTLGSLVKDIPFAIRTKIERMMNVNNHNDHNWRGLAAAMELSVDDVRQMEERENGKMTGLFDNMIYTKQTIKDFLDFLKHPAVQRLDVIDEIVEGCGLPKDVSENESSELDETDPELKRQLQVDGCFLHPEKYVPVKFLGSGGFAKVYLVIDKRTGKKMAAKMWDLQAIRSKTGKLLRYMEIEARALTSLKHEHIVEFFFAERISNTVLLLLEYMEGGTLEDLLMNNEPLEEPLVVKFTRQLLSAVDFLHTNGKKRIVHQDIKGGNILLDGARKNIKLTDFGVCTIMKELRSATKTNVCSFYWKSPEILAGKEFGRKTDIWSVGCTVVEMLTTKPPLFFETLSVRKKIFRIINHEIEPPTDCTPQAFGFLKRCLCRKENRASAAELLSDPFLKEEVHAQGVTSDPRNTVVSEMQLWELSRYVGNCWKSMGLLLFIAASKMLQINYNYSRNRDRAMALLIMWKQREGLDATVGRLADVLEKVGRKDIAEILLRGAENFALRTHTRGAGIEMSYDTFTGERPKSPSNQTGYMDMQIRKLPSNIIKKLSDQLDIDGPHDWRALISVMPIGMISQEQVSFFEMQRARTLGSPSMALLTELGQRTKTVRQLVVWLKKIGNCQALDILKYKEEVQIIKQPKSKPVSVGGTVTLRCEATGYPAPQYQWVKDGAELPNGIDEELTLDTVTMYDSGNYFCLVSNHVNAEKSDAVDLEVLPSPGVIKEESIEGIFTSEGGVMAGGNIRLVCPPGALDDSLSVTITLEDTSKYYSLIVQNDLENDVIIAAPIVNLQPNGHSFRKPMKLTTSFKHMKWKWNGDDVFILHGTEARDGKVTWQDITKSSKINEAAGEVEVELKHFSRILILLRWTLIRSKDILSRFDLLSFDYTLLVLLNKSSPSSAHDMLALLFVSQDVYHEQFYRENETSALVQLKKEGFIEVHEHASDGLYEKRIYNHENLQVSIQLGEDYKLSDSQHRSFSFSVDSFVWWNGGKVIKLPLEWRSEVRYLCGTISVNGENWHAGKKHFSEGDLCNYVRKLLGMEGNIFNVVTIARQLEMPEELMHQVTRSWEDDYEQLNLSLQHWLEKSAGVENLSSLRKCLESINHEEYNVTSRGQMHIRRLRKLATKITDLQLVNTDVVRYFSRQATILCNSVLRDCCLELNQDKVFSSSNNAEPFVKQFIENRQPMPEDISIKYKLVCSPSDESRTSIFLAIVPHLIQTIKEIFVDHKRLVPHSGLIGLHDDNVNQLLTSVLNARQNNRLRDLVYVECRILEKLCLKNHNKKPVAEITKWSESLAIEQMLNFLERFFKHCLHDTRLHKRLEIFSCRLRDTLLTDDKEVDEDYLQDFANILLSFVDFAKFDPSKLVRFELIDSKNSTLSSTSSDVENVVHDEYDDTYSQTFSIKKVSEEELQLGAAACVHIDGSICKKGAFQSVIILNRSDMDAFNRCMSRFAPAVIAVLKKEAVNKHSGSLQIVLYSSQKEKLSELIQIFKRELSEDMVDLSHSEVSQCHLSMRCIDFTKEKVLRLRLVYKWGSEAVALDSNDFVTFSDCSTGGACLPEGKRFGLDNSLMSEDLKALSLTSVDCKFPSTSFDELQKHGSAQCGKIEYHLHQTFNQVTSPHTCVIGNQATVNDQMPSQRALPEGLNCSPKRSITEGRRSSLEAKDSKDRL